MHRFCYEDFFYFTYEWKKSIFSLISLENQMCHLRKNADNQYTHFALGENNGTEFKGRLHPFKSNLL